MPELDKHSLPQASCVLQHLGALHADTHSVLPTAPVCFLLALLLLPAGPVLTLKTATCKTQLPAGVHPTPLTAARAPCLLRLHARQRKAHLLRPQQQQHGRRTVSPLARGPCQLLHAQVQKQCLLSPAPVLLTLMCLRCTAGKCCILCWTASEWWRHALCCDGQPLSADCPALCCAVLRHAPLLCLACESSTGICSV
jgi:hypothetical protein